jgi:hypothetical protein
MWINLRNMLRVKQITVCLLIANSLITGCDNSKAANESNFIKAINQALPGEELNCFPAEFSTGGLFPSSKAISFPIVGIKDREPAYLKPLAKVGLLSSRSVSEQVAEKIFGFKASATEYNLTELGKKFFTTNVGSQDSKEKESKFCLGEAEVDKIINFTEPQNQSSTATSDVKYTFKIKNIPQWAKDPDVQASIPKVAAILKTKDTPVEATMTLTLTSKGWSNEL